VHQYLNSQSIADSFSPLSKLAINDTLTNYYSFLISKEEGEERKQSLTRERTKLYAHRLKLTRSEPTLKSPSVPELASASAPHTGSRPSLFRVGAVYNSELGSGARFRLRPVSYDIIDLDAGHIPNSKLNMFNIEVTTLNGNLRLDRFDLVDIKTLNISRTGLPGDGGLGWGLRFGLERANNDCVDCLVGHLSGSGIKAKEINSRLSVYAEGELTFHSTFESGSLRSTLSLATVAKPYKSWKTHVVLSKRFSIDGDEDSRTILKWENRIGSDPKRNLRFDLIYDDTTEAHIGYGWYW